MRTTLVCIIAGAIGAVAIPAQAAPGSGEVRQVEVRHDDLNLLSESGMKLLERRLHHAAENVCGVREVDTGSRIPSRESITCYDRAMKLARRDMAAVRENQARIAAGQTRVARIDK